MIWQYYLASPVDGKPVGWHNYTPAASAKLDALCLQTRITAPSRTTFHVRSGYFHYEVNLTSETQRNATSGTVRPIRKLEDSEPTPKRHKKAAGPSLALEQLFAGGQGHVWEVLLTPLLEAMPHAGTFLAPDRNQAIVPVRELTFQALKPNPPGEWRVVVFGQNPYPRVESATGVAMFDNSYKDWQDKNFGKASSMRNIIKAAAMTKHSIPSNTTINQLRELLEQKNVVSPPQWFQAMLAQGVLLLNAALTVGGDDLTKAQHAKFWRPVIEHILEEILLAKSSFDDDDSRRGLLLLWWGGEALKTKKYLGNVFSKYDGAVPVKHLIWCNPAAQGDKFCAEPPHFLEVNNALDELGQKKIDWLPDETWMQNDGVASAIYSDFITSTQQLHALYLERLQNGLDAVSHMQPITGVLKTPLTTVVIACKPLGLASTASHALTVVKDLPQIGALSNHEKGAIYLYTGNSLYWRLNEALRSPNRAKVKNYMPYLHLFIRAHQKIPVSSASMTLYRGIRKDLTKSYPVGSTITWWSVSSCSSNMAVAEGFASGGTLFHVKAKTAVPIMNLSAFQSEEEYVLAPGTQLVVQKVVKTSKSLVAIFLEEKEGERLVS